MKLNFKTVLIIFLVALLGGGLGTYGVLSLTRTDGQEAQQSITSEPIIQEVTYSKKEGNNYSKAIDIAYNTVVEINATIATQTSSYFFFGGGGTTYSTASGSGVILSEDGYIVTNNHVVENVAGEDPVKVKLYNGEIYSATIIGTDSRTDLAVLKIDANNLPYATFADSDKLIMGEDVIAIGNPLGLGISCSNGIISALEKEIYINNVYLSVIQTNAAVNEGNSGGGLFDLNGNVVGIVNAKKTSNSFQATVEGMAYAIPSKTVERIVAEIMENGYVKDRAALGIKVYTGITNLEKGVVVSEVTKGGGAEDAGIKAQDIILSVDDTEVNSYADLGKVLDSKKVGDRVKVSVLRGNETKEFMVVLQQSVSN